MSTGNTGSSSTHYHFILPGYDDDADVDELNNNFTTIDDELYGMSQDISTMSSKIGSVGSTSLQSQVNTINDDLGHACARRIFGGQATTYSAGTFTDVAIEIPTYYQTNSMILGLTVNGGVSAITKSLYTGDGKELGKDPSKKYVNVRTFNFSDSTLSISPGILCIKFKNK